MLYVFFVVLLISFTSVVVLVGTNCKEVAIDICIHTIIRRCLRC